MPPVPYYQSERATLYHGDCVEVLRGMADQSIDAVITDPPYNVGFAYASYDDRKTREQFIEWARTWFVECRRIAQTVLITGQARLPDYGVIEPWKWLLAWWKPAAMGRSPVGFCNWEPVALWGRGDSCRCDVIRAPIKPDKSLAGHPCPKPLAWGEGLVDLLPWVETVLDPFAGSGTTGVACVNMGRKFIGIEIDENYCEIAAKRIQAAERAASERLVGSAA